eukprot:scaffold241_cov229-Prasinococcus_capsulatus_cf.AAC.1
MPSAASSTKYAGPARLGAALASAASPSGAEAKSIRYATCTPTSLRMHSDSSSSLRGQHGANVAAACLAARPLACRQRPTGGWMCVDGPAPLVLREHVGVGLHRGTVCTCQRRLSGILSLGGFLLRGLSRILAAASNGEALSRRPRRHARPQCGACSASTKRWGSGRSLWAAWPRESRRQRGRARAARHPSVAESATAEQPQKLTGRSVASALRAPTHSSSSPCAAGWAVYFVYPLGRAQCASMARPGADAYGTRRSSLTALPATS